MPLAKRPDLGASPWDPSQASRTRQNLDNREIPNEWQRFSRRSQVAPQRIWQGAGICLQTRTWLWAWNRAVFCKALGVARNPKTPSGSPNLGHKPANPGSTRDLKPPRLPWLGCDAPKLGANSFAYRWKIALHPSNQLEDRMLNVLTIKKRDTFERSTCKLKIRHCVCALEALTELELHHKHARLSFLYHYYDHW